MLTRRAQQHSGIRFTAVAQVAVIMRANIHLRNPATSISYSLQKPSVNLLYGIHRYYPSRNPPLIRHKKYLPAIVAKFRNRLQRTRQQLEFADTGNVRAFRSFPVYHPVTIQENSSNRIVHLLRFRRGGGRSGCGLPVFVACPAKAHRSSSPRSRAAFLRIHRLDQP